MKPPPAGSDAPLKILSAGSTVHGLRMAAAAKIWDRHAAIETDHGHVIADMVAAGSCDADIVVIPAGMIADLDGRGLLLAQSQRAIGTTGIGSAVRAGAVPPVIADPDSLAQAVRAAQRLYLTSAPTGVHMLEWLKGAGLEDILAGKLLQFERATDMLAALAVDEGQAFAFGPATELLAWREKGIDFGGNVPAALDQPLAYAAAVLNTSRRPAAALALLEEIVGPDGRQAFRRSGVV